MVRTATLKYRLWYLTVPQLAWRICIECLIHNGAANTAVYFKKTFLSYIVVHDQATLCLPVNLKTLARLAFRAHLVIFLPYCYLQHVTVVKIKITFKNVFSCSHSHRRIFQIKNPNFFRVKSKHSNSVNLHSNNI